MSNRDKDANLGAAILGFFAAIKICVKLGYDPFKVMRIVYDDTNAWGLLPRPKSDNAVGKPIEP